MSILHTYLKGAAERTYRRAMARVVVGLVGVGRLDNTKNVREKVNRSVLDRPIEIGFMTNELG